MQVTYSRTAAPSTALYTEYLPRNYVYPPSTSNLTCPRNAKAAQAGAIVMMEHLLAVLSFQVLSPGLLAPALRGPAGVVHCPVGYYAEHESTSMGRKAGTYEACEGSTTRGSPHTRFQLLPHPISSLPRFPPAWNVASGPLRESQHQAIFKPSWLRCSTE